MSNSELGFDTRLAHVYHCGIRAEPYSRSRLFDSEIQTAHECMAVRQGTSLFGRYLYGPSDYGFDTKFDVVLRDAYGNKLDFQKLSYEQPKFCFEGRKDSEYQLAFVLYKNGLRQPARVFPTRYRRNTDKANDVFYMIGAVCPGE